MSAYSELSGLIPYEILANDPMGKLTSKNRKNPKVRFKTRRQYGLDVYLTDSPVPKGFIPAAVKSFAWDDPQYTEDQIDSQCNFVDQVAAFLRERNDHFNQYNGLLNYLRVPVGKYLKLTPLQIWEMDYL